MKKSRFLLAAVLAMAVSATAIGQSSTSGPWANNQLPQVTYSTLPAASSVPSGVRFTATDLGTNGTDVVSNGTRWRASGGTATLVQLGAASGNITNTETIVCQTKLPIGAWQTNDTVRVWATGTKSGATDSGAITVRVGTAGTTADTAITGLSNFFWMAAGSLTTGGIYDVKLLSATSAQRLGPTTAGTMSYYAGQTGALAAATTITDASANSLWVSVSIASSGATNTVAVQSCQIQLITP